MISAEALAISDQTFSAENYKVVWDEQIRRGRPMASTIPAVLAQNERLRDLRRERKSTLAPLPLNSEERKNAFIEFSNRRSTLLAEKRLAIMTGLEELSLHTATRIDSSNYSLPLSEVGVRNKKLAYKVSFDEPADFFLVKQLERNLVKAFGISMTDRHKMVTQLDILLRDRSPKTLLKADLASFFESVPHAQLLSFLASQRALSRTSVMFLERFLEDFANLSGRARGLPRGVGLSSFLAEAYLQDLDAAIRDMPGVTFFSRYVDDIVVLCSHKRHDLATDSIKPIVRDLLRAKGLALNNSKTQVYSSADPHQYRLIKILGYEFRVEMSKGIVQLDMSKRRFDRYKERLRMTFERHAAGTGEGANTALVSRIRLLTGNHRVAKPLGITMMGVAFSNRSLSTVSPRLLELDRLLREHIDRASLPTHSLSRISNCSFAGGFESVRFERFRKTLVGDLGVIWKYAPKHD